MAYDNDQSPMELPNGNNKRRKSADHLPKYFRTQVNKKFLASTLDQMIQPGTVEKVNGYYGQKEAKGYTLNDFYVGDVSKQREDYQFEPAAVIKDDLDNVNFYTDYNDYINQLRNLGSAVNDHSILNRQEYYSWNPHINWDKFVNFREYYWLPSGPQTVEVAGQTDEVEQTITVRVEDNGDNYAYVFTPDGLTQNPVLTLYRGVTYRFEIDAPGNPMSFRTRKELSSPWNKLFSYLTGDKVNYEGAIYVCTFAHNAGEFNPDYWEIDTEFNLVDQVSAQGVDQGVIELTVDTATPDIIYYMSDNDVNASGTINVLDISESASIDVEAEIIGSKTYKTGTGIQLSNGMKIRFVGNVTPEIYASGQWYVEGVGERIKLIAEEDLNVPTTFTNDLEVSFDNEDFGFDRLPFSEAVGYPVNKDYITISRASQDGNLWTKYNRWFHKDVIEASAAANNQPVDLDQTARATRPIIEFEPNLKLFNFGTRLKTSVDLVDNFTKDIFSIIEGSSGYNIDDVDLTNGMRVLFTADTDPLVTGKIFEVKFLTFNNTRQITLVEAEDAEPLENEVLLCKQGTEFKGKMLWFNGLQWKVTQSKTTVNQAPLFDVFDKNGNSLSDEEVFDSSDFTGTKIFSYKQGNGIVDSELGFPLTYRSIENVGDIVFEFNLVNDIATYAVLNEAPTTVSLNETYLRRYSDRTAFELTSGWVKGKTLSTQSVIRQYIVDNTRTFYTVDVYDQSALLSDLWLRVYVNNSLKFENIDYTLGVDASENITITFTNELLLGDSIIIKTRSKAAKTENGKYEIAANLERNPLNKNITEFTLGEVNDHVGTIVEEVSEFSGVYPGNGNLRDLQNITQYGKRIVKHSMPANLPMYHIVDKDANAVKALRFARREYGKFKRSFLQQAELLGFSGPIKDHVDLILTELTKDKVKTMPFYFSDMVPFRGAVRRTAEVSDVDNQFFALTKIFTLESPSDLSVEIYQNGVQLVHGKDYTFNDQGFAIVTTEKQIGDVIDIYEYESTNGSYIPPTPTKLGLYPKYEPSMFVDDTYLEPQTVIQGHDGSITIAYGDFRDDLLLELEKRIYNNIKVEYNPDIFDIYDFIPGHTRTTDLTEQQINDAMIGDFVQWLQLVDNDYTVNSNFERTNSFTFNHTGMTDVEDHPIHGWWRAVYKYAYDTDRPHTHPWEMLGFTIKPTWWDSEYGEAPYTSNNLLMWEDIELGLIRDPSGLARINPKFARPGLTAHIPADEDGNLLSPVMSSFVKQFDSTQLDNNFVYGDYSPVETAWRRNSEYPFALLTSLMLNQPSRIFATCFDRIRQVRSQINDIVYVNENTHIALDKIVFPNTVEDTTRVYTAGIANYVFDYLASSVLATYDEYKDDIARINNQLGFKIGGFTSKDKFKLVLDSRTPTNKGNVFVPEENYKIFLNTSTPIKTIHYSGVIIEKQSYGFIVKGYNQEQPYFNYHEAIELQNDPLETIGGITASFLLWDEGKTYSVGTIVEYQNTYYRVVEAHTSTTEFDSNKFAKIPKLPEEGGREIYIRKAFKNTVSRLPYGKVFETIQDVVNFLLGYGHYLESEGFVFDYYDGNEGFVANWQTSAREFAFWTTQNWSAGAVITLSPGAFRIKFRSDYAVVSDIYDTFYGYSLLKADGKKLKKENASLTRENPGEFIIKPKATEDGIFGVRLALVQKEHAVIIDNKTVFGDIIYDQEPGYRQERIKVLGYKTGDWDGSLNIPGFIFDNAKITEWTAWQDYSNGDLVKYKEFYYAARDKVSGKENFDSNDWVRLEEKPEMELIPNWDYKVNQFADFYDLDSDNFDTEQQKFAQHLIGYQNRDYLANIINDDVSQYKFYQGMIQDKGTQNALTKLFDVLGSADKDSLEFYEEWAIKQGQYGASEGFEEVEYLLDEGKFKLEPQSFELVNRVTGEETDLIYRILPYETYLTPQDYDHAPFPTKTVTSTYTRNSGYVNPDDVDFVVDNYASIANIDFAEIKNENIVWVGNVGLDWNVYTYTRTDLEIVSVDDTNGVKITFNSIPTELSVGDVIGVEFYNVDDEVNVAEFVTITKILNNEITVSGASFAAADTVTGSLITHFISVRAKTFKDANELVQTHKSNISRIWVDEGTNQNWQVLNKENDFGVHQIVANTDTTDDQNYGASIAANRNNTLLVVGAPDNGDGKVFVYVRASNQGSFQLNQIIDADDALADELQRFGASVDVSEDGKYLVVGSPAASNVKTLYTGDFVESKDYAQYDIVRYEDILWEATTDIQGAEDAIQFSSFDSVAQITDDLNLTLSTSEKISSLLTGNYPFNQLQTNHFIVKAPFDMYEGTDVGYTVEFVWNKYSAAYQDTTLTQEVFEVGDVSSNWITRTNYTAVEPFKGAVTGITSEYLTGTHEIYLKVDSILYVENSTTIPLVGQVVETQTGFGTVAYRYSDGAKVTLYINEQNGTFGTQGSLTTSIGEFVGEYQTVAPSAKTVGAEEKWGGYWVFLYTGNTDIEVVDNAYIVVNDNEDVAKGLVIKDVVPTGETPTTKLYENVLNYRPDNTFTKSLNILNSQITSLTYYGAPGAPIDYTLAGSAGETREYPDSRVVVRVPPAISDAVSPGSFIKLYVNEMENFETGVAADLAYIGVTSSEMNTLHQIDDVWDGYIDVTIKEQLDGRLVEPKVGQTVKDLTNLGEAEVVFYQRFNPTQARIYVKTVTGTWALGDDFGENREIAFLSDGSGDPFYDPISGSRKIGEIQRRSFEDNDSGLGKLIVLDLERDIEWQGDIANIVDRHDTLYDAEYWLYTEDTGVLGIERLANIPASNKTDWRVVYNLPVIASGYQLDEPLQNEGMYSIYQRQGIGQFTRINTYIVPDRYEDNNLGVDVKFAKLDELYRLFVKTNKTEEQPGRIYIINDGEQADQSYGWEFSRNKNYKGVYNASKIYFENDVVIHQNAMYRAFTTTQGEDPTNSIDWIQLEEVTDYLGYLPNLTGTYIGDSTTVIDDTDQLLRFAKDFDASRNGEVFVVSTEYAEGFANTLEIYRNINGSFYRSQSIDAPNKTSSYGNSIAMSNDGKLIAVGASGDDTEGLNHGKVYVYTQVNGQFELSQELYSPTKERTELFGWSVDFDGNRLIVGSRNGDSSIETTFDGNNTLFDNDFLRFKRPRRDTGVVRVYERLGDTLGFATVLDLDENVSPQYFGRSVKLSNNHVYVGLPKWEGNGKKGSIIDYRIADNTTVWNVLRQSKDTVDVSKIKRVMLYNTATQEIISYLDYIDVLQGKIAGPAEQELTYKTYYDPATYTTGVSPNTSKNNSWGPEQVGQLWWDLTNAKFRIPYQDNVIFSANNWNSAFSDSNSIDIYEWVESTYLPSEWDELSGTNKGLQKGITGKTRSGDDAYVVKRKYNTSTGTFTNYFYYWVGQKTTVPQVDGRILSAYSVSKLIKNPASEGYKFISLIGKDQFALHNCETLVSNNDVALSIQYWTIDNQDINIHNQYQILTEGLETSKPGRDIERKWIDSLVGFDDKNRQVPAPELSPKERYGILNKPRQGWFVNKTEALKQFIERANSALMTTLIADDKDITPLTAIDEAPTEASNRWDRTVDTATELQFVGVAKARRAILEPQILDGKIIAVDIVDSGRGYLQAPTVTVFGQGSNAEIETEINSRGEVVAVNIINDGNNYSSDTRLIVRRYTVLVLSDDTLNGNWALYERDVDAKEWVLVQSQAYDVSKYWEYADWYAEGYNSFTQINFVVDFSYDLPSINDTIGDVIKIQNVGTGGWLLLEKIDAQTGVDYSVNYKTIGRQNGTIQIKSNLYNIDESLTGYGTTSYDVLTFDGVPTGETRIIIETLRDNVFIDELAIVWNELFFASLRYVFAEQKYVDWAFKTSFIRAKHNVGLLEQKINFQNDNLPSYEQYIEEVKPYKTKLREYLSSYGAFDNTQTVTTDFDLPARFDPVADQILPLRVKTSSTGIVIDNVEEVNTYPNKNWLDNAGFKVKEIRLADPGSGYKVIPQIRLEGGSGTGATAVATLGRNGSISAIIVTNEGDGYLEAPTVVIDGTIGTDGIEAKAVAIIEETPVRRLQTVVKFDRVSGDYEFINLDTSESFTSSSTRLTYELKWPMDLRTNRVTVYEDGKEVLARRYTYRNVLDQSKGYDRYYGEIEFIEPIPNGVIIKVDYFKSINLLKAQDRINLTYEPTGDNYGKTLGQLMDGVDYGGVEVRSFDFGGTTGWNTAPWMSQAWDLYDTTFEDEIFRLDGSTIAIELSKPLEDGVEYNLYRTSYDINGQLVNNQRMDDPNYGTPEQTNDNAVMLPIIGDGEQTVIDLADLGVSTIPEDSTEQAITIIVRKSTSDGSFIADPESYDTAISGGDLTYSTATGLNSADINIDGDGFVTPTTSKGPEEIVPGQVLDTLDIQVFEKPTGGASQITSRNFIGDGVQTTFNLGHEPGSFDHLFVKIDYVVQTQDDYTIDFARKQIVFNTAPANDARISIVDLGVSAATILDIDAFTGNGQAVEFLTNARWEDNANAYVTVDGVKQDVALAESDDTYEREGNFVIKFPTAPANGASIQVLLAVGGIEVFQQYSTVTIDEFTADGSTVQFDLSQAPFETQPESAYTIVKVGNKILDPGYSQSFEVTTLKREYQLDLTQVPVASVNSYDLAVYLNDIELEFLQTWTFEGAGSFDPNVDAQSQPGSTITLEAGIGEDGDELKVYVLTSGEYRMGYYDGNNEYTKTPGTIHLDSAYTEGDTISVYQFSNHNSQGIERQSFEVTKKTDTTPGTELYYSFALLQKGYITLRKPARDAEYVWVVKNGNLLTPSVDYSLTSNKQYVKLVEQPTEGDKLQVIHFADQIVVDKFGWRQFKDMLNRVHYKRLQEVHHLAESLNWYDDRIVLVDAEGLPNPEDNPKYPGVIFIEGERIEYFKRVGNELLQIRRGTLGTGIKNVYDAGTMLMEQGVDATMPYKDESDVITVTAGGYSQGSETYENSDGMNVTNIEYNFNNNTAFPVRVEGVYEQVCTVTGEGFTPRVKVFVGETEATTRYISDTQLEFDVPGFNVPGAYDLIIVNPFTTVPIDTPQTSFVVPGGIKYVQILLPFAPIPNPKSAEGWYKETIPEEYWEAQDIEVFVAGRRLRKTPIDVYDYEAQDSPEGDITLEAEYAVNKNIGAYVRLTTPPPEGTTVNIIRKIGTLWSETGEALSQSDSNVAKFLRAKTTELPR